MVLKRAKKFFRDLRASWDFVNMPRRSEAEQGRAKFTWWERHVKMRIDRHEGRLKGEKARKAKEKLDKAFAIDVGCGSSLSRIAKYAKENPNKVFVGVNVRNLNKVGKAHLKSFPNLFFVRADALDALKLLEPNSKTVINMDNFPYFDYGKFLPQNLSYRQRLFSGVFRALKSGGSFTLTTDKTELAVQELSAAGFKVGKPRQWGQGSLSLEYGSPETRSWRFSGRGLPFLIVAKKLAE